MLGHQGGNESLLSGAAQVVGAGKLLSKSRFLFMAAFRERFNEKVVAEMRGVIDEHGYSSGVRKSIYSGCLGIRAAMKAFCPVPHR
jgi:hypothetical protein